MNVQATHVIPMLPVLTMKVLLSVNVILGLMELDLIVLVSKFFHSCMCLKYLTFFRETTKRGPQVRGLPSWTWSVEYTRGPLAKFC